MYRSQVGATMPLQVGLEMLLREEMPEMENHGTILE